MSVAAIHHLGYLCVVARVQRGELASPTDHLGVVRVAAFALGQDVPHGVKLAVFPQEVGATQRCRFDVPDPHVPHGSGAIIAPMAASQPPDGPRRALVAGATGFIGGRLTAALATAGWKVRCLVRDLSRAGHLEQRGFEMHEGDVLREESLRGAGVGVDVAYYLVHSMGRGNDGAFAERERAAAEAFARMARREGVQRVVYLGGLGDDPKSQHLRSRHATAELLAEHGAPLTYFRAGMVVGPESESYRTLRYLVQRLPAMIAPAWLKTPTQPIAIDDVLEYLVRAPSVDAAAGREIQIGGPDVLSYGEMLDRMAEALGKRPRPTVLVPLLTPWLSSLWIGLVTPVDSAVARPLIEGLSTPTVVTDRSGATLFDVQPISFGEALRRAVSQDPELSRAG